jgi:hypothetical protein
MDTLGDDRRPRGDCAQGARVLIISDQDGPQAVGSCALSEAMSCPPTSAPPGKLRRLRRHDLRLLANLTVILALAAFNGKDHRSPPSSSLPVAGWTIGPMIHGESYSPGMPRQPGPSARGEWEFSFPTCGRPPDGPQGRGRSVNYLTTLVRAPITESIRVTFEVMGDADALSPTEGTDPRIRLYFQRRGDDWSGEGPMSGYRWFSRAHAKLRPGTHTLAVPLTYGAWGGVQTPPTEAEFEAAKRNPEVVGFTFGGSLTAGHGVCITEGSARFILKAFSVQ